jgi:hypothetical protein
MGFNSAFKGLTVRDVHKIKQLLILSINALSICTEYSNMVTEFDPRFVKREEIYI